MYVCGVFPHGVEVPTRVLVADDSELVRQAIVRTLQNDCDIVVVGEAANFESAVRLANELKPQIIVLDLHMPDQERFTAESFRSELTNGCQIVAISFSNDVATKTLARNLEAGVLLEKMVLGTELIPAIKKMAS
jgi:DNA-binding NarL/FixJ family response regulator